MRKGIRLSNEEAIKNIQEKCKEKNISFLGFDNEQNEYVNNKTHLLLKCNKCGHIWNNTMYLKLVNANHGTCPNCAVNRKKTEEEIIDIVNEKCKEKNFTFLGFKDGFNGIQSKLILKCNKCKTICDTSTYANLIREDRLSHHCGMKIRKKVIPTLNVEKAIESLKEKLKNTSLEFVSFDENGYIGSEKCKVYLKCKKCGEKIKYTYEMCIYGNIKCKKCECGRFSNEYASNRVKEKCKYLNYTFLGFDNEENKYKGKHTYLILKCNKCGYVWKSTTFASFSQTTIKCMGCSNSWKMEKEIEMMLQKHSINFIHNCRAKNLPWLKNKASLSLDFYLPEYNIGIECQGRQHFMPVPDFGGEKQFIDTVERDKKKLQLCKENGVKLLYYDSNLKHSTFLNEKVFNNENNLIKEIING